MSKGPVDAVSVWVGATLWPVLFVMDGSGWAFFFSLVCATWLADDIANRVGRRS